MGFFTAVFGQGARTETARELAIGRLGYIPSDEIDSDTLTTLLSRVEKMSTLEVMSLPEEAIVTIIATYAELIQKRVDHREAIRRIEEHRLSLGSRPADFKAMSLDDYVAYRLTVELPNGPMPGMDDYWFNRCMSVSCKAAKLPWHGGPTEPPHIHRPR